LTKVVLGAGVNHERKRKISRAELLAGLTTIFNVADHILATKFHEHPETYEGLLDALHAHSLISGELRRALRGAGGFRNVLVHEHRRRPGRSSADVPRSAGDLPLLRRGGSRLARKTWRRTRSERLNAKAVQTRVGWLLT